MKLEKYLKKNEVNKSEFCRLLEINYSTLHHWISGARKPSAANCLKIVDFTSGEVTIKELIK